MNSPTAPTPSATGSRALVEVVLELEQYAADQGWDQAPRLFALVRTAELLDREPQLAALLGLEAPATSPEFTSLEQTDLPPYETLEGLLSGITLGEGVAGAALVIERVMLPPGAARRRPVASLRALDASKEEPGLRFRRRADRRPRPVAA